MGYLAAVLWAALAVVLLLLALAVWALADRHLKVGM
jgi:hypothetical protein